MSKIKHENIDYFYFYCVGCKRQHTYSVHAKGWQFNGNILSPSFTPSLLNTTIGEDNKVTARCHLFVTDGKIVYCGDCTHELSGQTVDLVDF